MSVEQRSQTVDPAQPPRILSVDGTSKSSQPEDGEAYHIEFGDGFTDESPVDSPALESLCRLVKQGLLSPDRFWAVFDECLVFMVKPNYYGASFWKYEDGRVMTPLFSSVQNLARFAGDSAWVSLQGKTLLALDIAPKLIVIDPRDPHTVLVDVASRQPIPAKDQS